MTDYHPNKVAVIIPAYNAEATIERAIESALGQVLPEGVLLDVIVVDDCSTDATPQIVKRLAETHTGLTFLRQSQNAGPSAARNRALNATDAAWFTPLDSDDFMTPKRLSQLIETAHTGGWQIVADNLIIAHSDKPKEAIRLLWPDKPKGLVEMSLAYFIRHNLGTYQERSELGYTKPLIDRRIAAASKELYRSKMRFAEDYDLYSRLIADGARACLIDAAGYYAVQRGGSLSRTPKAADFARLIETDRSLLQREALPAEASQYISMHKAETEEEWAWVRAIEAVRARNIAGFLSSFFVSPQASLSLAGNLFKHFFGPRQDSNKHVEAAQ